MQSCVVYSIVGHVKIRWFAKIVVAFTMLAIKGLRSRCINVPICHEVWGHRIKWFLLFINP